MIQPDPVRPRWLLWLIRGVLILAGLYIALLVGLMLRAAGGG